MTRKLTCHMGWGFPGVRHIEFQNFIKVPKVKVVWNTAISNQPNLSSATMFPSICSGPTSKSLRKNAVCFLFLSFLRNKKTFGKILGIPGRTQIFFLEMMNIQLGNQIFNQKESPKRKIGWILVVSVLVDAETKSDLLKDHWPQQKIFSASHSNGWRFLGIPNAKSTNRVVLRSSVYGILAAMSEGMRFGIKRINWFPTWLSLSGVTRF